MKKSKLAIGRGRLFFNAFEAGTRMPTVDRYVGNTPNFSVSRVVETITAMTSVRGRKQIRRTETLSEAYTLAFTSDDIDRYAISRWYGQKTIEGYSNPDFISFSKTVNLGESIRVPYPNSVTHLVYGCYRVRLYRGAYELIAEHELHLDDLAEGIITIREDAATIVNGDTLRFDCEKDFSIFETFTNDNTILEGSLRFVSKNPVGARFNYFFPCVQISPVGPFDQKADGWLTISYSAIAKNLTPNTPLVYIERPVSNAHITIPDNFFNLEETFSGRVNNLMSAHYRNGVY